MNFAAICPTEYLERLTGSRKVHFCLAQVAERSDTYYLWYQKKAQEEGNVVILDNGAYEGDLLTFEPLWAVALLVKPQVLILPDVIGDPKLTAYLHQSFKQFMKMHSNVSWPLQYMRVIQVPESQDHYDDENRLFIAMKQYMECQESWIGFPRHLGDLRRNLTERLHQIGAWRHNKNHHALGMLDGDVREFSQLAKLGFYSGDSSNPVWRAGKQKGPIDFSKKYFDSNATYLINKALKEVDVACSSK